MDSYAEHLVQREVTTGEKTKRAVLITVCTAFCLVILYFSVVWMPMLMFLAAGAIYGTYILIKQMHVEYEYLVTNGEMDIDKIIGKEKRQRLLTVKIKSFEAFGMLSDAPEAAYECTQILAGDGNPAYEYYAEFNHETHGKVRLVFSPNEAILSELDQYMSRNIRK